MNQTQCCALKFLCFEGATIQTRNEAVPVAVAAPDWSVCGAVNHSAGSFRERRSCCFTRNCHVIFPYQSNLRSSGFMVGVVYGMKHVPALQCRAAITSARSRFLG